MAIYEGFGGKRALGFLLKSELCQKRSKFRMQLCLGVFNNVLHVFCLKFASFLRHYVCKKHIFPRASSGDLLLNVKQKKRFVSLKDEVTIIHSSLTSASLAKVDEALSGPDSNLFCRDAGSIPGRSIFFFSLCFCFFQKPRYLFVIELPFLIARIWN